MTKKYFFDEETKFEKENVISLYKLLWQTFIFSIFVRRSTFVSNVPKRHATPTELQY